MRICSVDIVSPALRRGGGVHTRRGHLEFSVVCKEWLKRSGVAVEDEKM